ncbi:MAG: hypothetical protein J6R96_01135 [Spirochaetaceae bacterium]|nr:hypothetical protein [Spirochaetaceae bacterium]
MNEVENHAKNHDAIIYTHWPQVSQRKRMPLESRAKIFMPFSALKGLTQAIQRQVRSQEQLQEGNEGGKND